MRAKHLVEEGTFVCRLEHGRDAIAQIREFAKGEGMKSATFTLIGAVKSATLSFYDQVKHRYHERRYDEPLEIASCIGNVCSLGGEPLVHAHAVLSRADDSCIGGHVKEMEVYAAELHLRCYREGISRVPDDVTGLNLMDIDQARE
jgi:uncharacterized protein